MDDDIVDVRGLHTRFFERELNDAKESLEKVAVRCERFVDPSSPTAVAKHHVGKRAADIHREGVAIGHDGALWYPNDDRCRCLIRDRLPESLDRVGVEYGVRAENAQALVKGLRHQHSVEGVPVMER